MSKKPDNKPPEIEILPTGAKCPEGYRSKMLESMIHLPIRVKSESKLDDGSYIIDWSPEAHYYDMINVIFGAGHRRNVVMKGRRAFMTTTFAIAAMIKILQVPYFNAGLVNWQKQLGVEQIFDKLIRSIVENTPAFEDFELTKGKIKYPHPPINKKYPEGRQSTLSAMASLRSGGADMLHFTDFGKFSTDNPTEAKEALAGSLESSRDAIVVIESTNAGQSGAYADIVRDAYERQKLIVQRRKEGVELKLSKQEILLFFFGWHEKKALVEPLESKKGRTTSKELLEYFEEKERVDGIYLTPEQKWWYECTFNSNVFNQHFPSMFEEYPTTFEEAFSVVDDAVILAPEIMVLKSRDRYGDFPPNDGLVDVSFDIGWTDSTVMLFWQKRENGFYYHVDTYRNSNKQTAHYIDVMNRKGFHYGKIILPHDAAYSGTDASKKMNDKNLSFQDEFHKNGYRNTIVIPKLRNQEEVFNIAKRFMASCFFNANYEQSRTTLQELNTAVRRTVGGQIVGELQHNNASHVFKAFEAAARFYLDPMANRNMMKKGTKITNAKRQGVRF